ncbi:MAG: succinate dehydrogenase assembly factor 2 [Proteobacteria bacterium]|jgi:succinate dehydrogenase flavin-adding protein (antitoxin of CptAB toxin-antitoxin module)|nr:succinate dehydrogenase assembly factor 2 [Pseudomonadota bacterium]MDA0941987.1 succinate dehydrogenase assembly factor 2 [Pseudomonadota bacterium]MDA1034838.1 succinate dehydrogenase assembly factor 2 [Pseudomonadota bacterium]
MNIDQVIRYKSRRGLLELDLVLADFYKNDYQALSDMKKQVLLNILKKQDNELWKILSKKNLKDLIDEEAAL